jgi:hypothetical protein
MQQCNDLVDSLTSLDDSLGGLLAANMVHNQILFSFFPHLHILIHTAHSEDELGIRAVKLSPQFWERTSKLICCSFPPSTTSKVLQVEMTTPAVLASLTTSLSSSTYSPLFAPLTTQWAQPSSCTEIRDYTTYITSSRIWGKDPSASKTWTETVIMSDFHNPRFSACQPEGYKTGWGIQFSPAVCPMGFTTLYTFTYVDYAIPSPYTGYEMLASCCKR